MLSRRDAVHGDTVPLGQRRDGRQVLQRLAFLRLVRLVVQHMVAVEQHARAGGAEHVAAEVEVHLGRLEHRRRHLRGHEAPPNQLVQLEEVGLEVLLELLGPALHFGRPDRLVRVLDARLALALLMRGRRSR